MGPPEEPARVSQTPIRPLAGETALSFGHNQELIQGEKEQQEIAEGCRRLIKNAILCWNYLHLSQKRVDEEKEDRKAALIEAVRKGSLVTWQHLNLPGEYDFSEENLQDSVGLRVPKILSLEGV